eukprot:TRINITY_DN13252_c0_g1_i3.p2 TRINITY_DN13252_c0_g1~~TRINITY_DN13252_c0_g1_i3.p2  ORF type:complete len:199 (-),score=32.19 TRINITY_DN13252_c0_g1_i3:206-802(-)
MKTSYKHEEALMIKVKDLMTSPVFSLKDTDSLQHARELMNLQRIRHIPIVTVDNIFSGLITHRDILSATISKLAGIDAETQREIDSGIPIHEIMQTGITSIDPDTSLKEAAQILLNHKYGCLPVVKNGELTGIITEADFLRLTIHLMEGLDTTRQPSPRFTITFQTIYSQNTLPSFLHLSPPVEYYRNTLEFITQEGS